MLVIQTLSVGFEFRGRNSLTADLHDKWRQFTSRPIPPLTSSEVMIAVSCESRETVDAMNKAAIANGGAADIKPVQDLGFMYNRSVADPDGHIWEAVWMDPAAIPSGDKKSN
jgi:predicted lactoylglutathione lyase